MPDHPEVLSERAVAAVREQLRAHLDRQRQVMAAVAPEVLRMDEDLEAYLGGGKMLRPLFCYWGGVAVHGAELSDGAAADLARAGAAIELVQAAALLHDDVIDHSPTRRGRPAAHMAAAARHRADALSGSSEDFGEAFAIILGDLALAWSEQLFSEIDRDHAVAGREEFDLLRTEVMGGQYLDVLHQAGGFASAGTPEEAAMAVIRWKTVPYTVLRPLRMGAALMGASTPQLDLLERWAVAIGTAFQLRDDLLSVVGDPQRTGKPVGGDIVEGKRTVVLARALEAADAGQRAALEAALGDPSADPEAIAAAHAVLVGTGAVDSVRADVERLAREAAALMDADDLLRPLGRAGLGALADAATDLSVLRPS
ncbi:polyprenyl synthetase family protein [Brachybacterium phenoliresistens]|uniref:Geranylgeranyl diphosphate synthase n=1 Tax=Brachybacterium phenoliresistens TaxID=396014 RepID=Z9JWZ0_9MICO|nr:polyprenyl synthetase family protein [Brachybacterium phenoliresistens]EWS82890.1 geranylgeranyl diphosphate synthase [Brachybacterium phenoliresistens]